MSDGIRVLIVVFIGTVIALTVIFPASVCYCYNGMEVSGYEGDGIVSWTL